jgi:hypothetical protein
LTEVLGLESGFDSARTAFTNPILYNTQTGGSGYPFLEAGNLVISPRISGAVRDVVFMTGTTPSIAVVIDRNQKFEPRVGVLPDGGGFKHTRIASGTTGGSLHDIASATWTFGTAFVDTNYTIVVTIDNPTGVPIVAYTENKAEGSIDIVIIAGSATAASGTLNCIAVHD